MAAGGLALARGPDGRVVLVEGALPGETVEVRVRRTHRQYDQAEVTSVLEPSPHRVAPPCAHWVAGCGGCDWQHVASGAQTALKVDIVTDALRRIGGVAHPPVTSGPSLPVAAYRTTLRAVVADGRAALRRRRSHEAVTVEDCLVAHPLLGSLLRDGRFGAARGVTLRCGARTGERLALVEGAADRVELPADVRVVSDADLAAGRRAWYHEDVAGAALRVSARSFFQAGPEGAEALVAAVRAALEGAPEGALIDAYGGVGLFGATVAAGRPVTVVEQSASAAADARVNLPGARVVRSAVERWRPRRAAAVVADPARTGLGPEAVDVLSATGAGRLALVSCDAASLGRDARLLAGRGFRLEESTVVDMFPRTSHVEVVSRFVR